MEEDLHAFVRSQYAAAAQSGLSGNDSGVRAIAEAFGYSPDELDVVPAAANLGLSCGNPTALAGLRRGEVVIDLGSGGGMDVLLAAAKVGPTGKAIGIDMTPEMVSLARRNASKAGVRNAEFHLAQIDRLPLPSASADCVISNCVINLATDKPAVFREVYRVLRPGGRVAISDIATRRPLPEELAVNLAAYVGCLAGAISIQEYRSGLTASGFEKVSVVDTDADLNAYALAANQSCCCSPSMAEQGDSSDTACRAEGLHERLSRLLARFDVNHYAASVRVYGIKAATP